MIRLMEAGDTPYLLCGDFNITPQQSPTIASLIAKGILVDVPQAFGLGSQHTFSHNEPPKEGVEGKGRTRIDTILANKAAFPLITDCTIRWGKLNSDHTPIEVVLNVNRYGAEIKEPKLQPPFPEVKWTATNRIENEEKRDEAWNNAWAEIERKFCNAERRLDVEEMHRLWCKAAVKMLRAITDTTSAPKFRHVEKKQRWQNLAAKRYNAQPMQKAHRQPISKEGCTSWRQDSKS